MSKFDFPVRASIPGRLSWFAFSGILALLRLPKAAFVTQGGLPKIRSGSGRAAMRDGQSA